MILSMLENGTLKRVSCDSVSFDHCCNVLCVGAGSAGIYAADAAASEGAKVILCEIDENIGGGMGYPLKPQPDALLYLMQKYHAAPGNTWVVGDNHTDIFLAANGGVRSIFCTYGFGHKAASASSFDAASFAEAVEILQANQ